MTATGQPLGERLLRLREVKARTGLGKTSIYAYEKRGEFPRRVRIGPLLSGWVASEVDAWIADQIANARSQ